MEKKLPTLRIAMLGSILVFIAITLLYLNGTQMIRSDGDGYFLPLRSLIIDGDLHYANEIAEYEIAMYQVDNIASLRTVTDHVPNKYSIGPALLWLPFFLFAHFITLLLNVLGQPTAMDGYSVIYQLMIGYGSAFYGLAGLALAYKCLRKFFDQLPSIISVVAIAIGGNVLYYLTVEPSMSHNCSLFSTSLFIYIWLFYSKHRRYWMFLGLAIGLMSIVRTQNVLFSIILLPQIITQLKDKRWQGIAEMIPLPIFFFIGILPQLVVWKILYGAFVTYSYENESFNFLEPHFMDSLFSPKHGLIQWTPIVGLALIGLIRAWKISVNVVFSLWVCFLLQWIVNASWWCWWFGMSYGNRAYINCTIVFVFGLASLLQCSKGYWKVPMYTILTFLVVHNLLFYMQYSAGLYLTDQEVSFFEALINHAENLHIVLERFRLLLQKLLQ